MSTINDLHNKTPSGVWSLLYRLMTEHPDAKIVTWMDEDRPNDGCDHELIAVLYHEKLNKIELTFE